MYGQMKELVLKFLKHKRSGSKSEKKIDPGQNFVFCIRMGRAGPGWAGN